jgi:tetrachlorobenzoquinone reductase
MNTPAVIAPATTSSNGGFPAIRAIQPVTSDSSKGSGQALTLRVHSITLEADDIYSFDFRGHDDSMLPPFSAGAHLNISIPGDLKRSFSLVNSQDERHRYVIAVARSADSRGGSAFMCERLRVGHFVEVVGPVNTFSLVEDAPHSVLVAGGIGVTPILSMVERLEALGQRWRLHYAARTRKGAAFVDRIQALGRDHSDRVHVTFDAEPGHSMLDLGAIVAAQDAGTHFYCCGPAGMLLAFESAVDGIDSEFVHTESFSARVPAAQGGFEVVLAKSKKTIFVPEGKSILEALNEHGLRISYSCKQGVCGTCEMGVIAGIPDHRDAVLSKRERESNRKIIICCSGSLSERLILDC